MTFRPQPGDMIGTRIIPDLVAPGTVPTLPPDATLRRAAQVIIDGGAGAAWIAEESDQRPRLLTEADIVRAIAQGADCDTTLVGAVPLQAPDALAADDTPFDAMSLMAARRVSPLPVLDGHEVVALIAWPPLLAAAAAALDRLYLEMQRGIFGCLAQKE